jgi:hypothetical protein
VASLDELWLETFNRLCARAAHDLKGALNGVSVNLEVVRSRASKPNAPATAVSQYAEAATQQLTQVIGMTEAVLGLGRPAPEPSEVAPVLRRTALLLGPGLETTGRRLEVVEPLPDLGTTPVSGTAVRVAVGAALLAATETSARVVCAGEVADGLATICIDHGGVPLQSLGTDMMDRLREAGVRLETSAHRITIAIPRI